MAETLLSGIQKARRGRWSVAVPRGAAAVAPNQAVLHAVPAAKHSRVKCSDRNEAPFVHIVTDSAGHLLSSAECDEQGYRALRLETFRRIEHPDRRQPTFVHIVTDRAGRVLSAAASSTKD